MKNTKTVREVVMKCVPCRRYIALLSMSEPASLPADHVGKDVNVRHYRGIGQSVGRNQAPYNAGLSSLDAGRNDGPTKPTHTSRCATARNERQIECMAVMDKGPLLINFFL
ncbi:hypothetical protein TNCV_1808191 [Trichonephila clavipes]|nr:hypothetical protein TNCV_1808191 [Trichonephila clavipes]